jgi:hypothetical protein
MRHKGFNDGTMVEISRVSKYEAMKKPGGHFKPRQHHF